MFPRHRSFSKASFPLFSPHVGDKMAFKKADKGFSFLITTVAHFSTRILKILCPTQQEMEVWSPSSETLISSPNSSSWHVPTQISDGDGHFQVLHQQVNPKFEFQLTQKKADERNFMSCSFNQPPALRSLPKSAHTHLAGNHGLSFPFPSSRRVH